MNHAFSFQGDLRYSIVGDYPAPNFFKINQNDGRIFLSSDLKNDSLKLTNYNVSQIEFLFPNLLTFT